MKYSYLKIVWILGSLFYLNNISCQQPAAAADQNLRVIILRHGEKPDEGENLSCQGLNRALQLPNVLYNKIKLPDYIYVPSLKTGKGTGVARMYQTIVPYAVKYNLNIDTQFDVSDGNSLAKSVLKKTGTVLIVWEHKTIPDIVQALGVDAGKLKWDGNDYDSIWIVSFKNGKAKLSYDKENINPTADCK
jgi:hypothetical protein